MWSAGMPVLGLDHIVEALRQGIDRLDDLVAPGDGKTAAGEKIILDVDDDQSVIGARAVIGIRRFLSSRRRAEPGMAVGSRRLASAPHSSKVYCAAEPSPLTCSVTSVDEVGLDLGRPAPR